MIERIVAEQTEKYQANRQLKNGNYYQTFCLAPQSLQVNHILRLYSTLIVHFIRAFCGAKSTKNARHRVCNSNKALLVHLQPLVGYAKSLVIIAVF